jgi:inner membrane protein
MLLFGHIGFTLAGALLLNSVILHARFRDKPKIDEQSPNSAARPVLKGPSAEFWGLIERTKGLDLRFVIIGSLLPDIIDKPIGHYFFYDVYGNGYLYGHTLLFVLLLAAAGYAAYLISQKSFLLWLAFGSMAHLILDFIFFKRRVFLWPLYGFAFPRGTSPPFGEWLLGLVTQLFHRPWAAAPEVLGAIITIGFFWLLWNQKRLRSFVLKGQV